MLTRALLAAAVLLTPIAAAAQAATAPSPPPVTTITLPGDHLFPESLTALSDGTIFVGSVGKGLVWRIPKGSTEAQVFIPSGTADLGAVFGIYADQRSNTLWVCSDRFKNTDTTPITAKSFDLKTGKLKASYTLGDTTFCNDFAVTDSGIVYIADTRQSQLLMLRPGATDFEVAIKDPLLEGVDGLGFGTEIHGKAKQDPHTLYVNSVTKNKLIRVTLGDDGKGTQVTELTLPRAIERPDGMRAIGNNRFLLAEGTGKLDLVTITQREKVAITTIKDGLELTPATVYARGLAWVAEGKLAYRSTPEKDPGQFRIYGFHLPR